GVAQALADERRAGRDLQELDAQRVEAPAHVSQRHRREVLPPEDLVAPAAQAAELALDRLLRNIQTAQDARQELDSDLERLVHDLVGPVAVQLLVLGAATAARQDWDGGV